MKALVYEGERRVVLKDVPEPVPADDEVLVETRAVGICGSDIGIYRGEFPKIVPPLTIGHEGGGVVRSVGPRVRSVSEGDRVAVSPIVACGRCEFCIGGRFSLCDALQTIGMIGRDGEYAEYFVAPERNCHRIPDSIGWDNVGMIDTLAGPVLSLERTKVPLHSTVVIFGPGPAGLLFARLAKLSGAGLVILVGTREERLSLGKQFGVDGTVHTRTENVVAEIAELTGERGADLVIEAAGSADAVHDGVSVLRKGGQLLLYGVFDGRPVPVDLLSFVLNEYSCFGISDNTGGYAPAIRMMAEGTVDPAPLVSHVLSLQELPGAFAGGMIERRTDGYLKGIVRLQ